MAALMAQFQVAADPAAALAKAAPAHLAYLALQQALSGPARLSMPPSPSRWNGCAGWAGRI